MNVEDSILRSGNSLYKGLWHALHVRKLKESQCGQSSEIRESMRSVNPKYKNKYCQLPKSKTKINLQRQLGLTLLTCKIRCEKLEL